MKLLFIIIFLPLLSFGQKILHETDGQIMYSQVVNADSVSRHELFLRAKTWFADEYNSSKDVIQLEDENAGIIIGKGLFDVIYIPSLLSDPVSCSINHTVKILFKDGKYKFEIYELSGTYVDEYGLHTITIKNDDIWYLKKREIKFLHDIDDRILKIQNSLIDAMNKKSDFSF